MKNCLICALLLSLLLMGGCNRNTGQEETSANPELSELEIEEMPSEEEQPPPGGEPLPDLVADAAMYRGIIRGEAVGDDGQPVLLLEQADGTDFGYEALRVTLTESTRIDFDYEDLETGNYLEVFYGGTVQGEDAVQAIQVRKLIDAELCVLNGELLETADGEEEGGTLVIRDLATGDEIHFHYSDETQFYLNRDDLSAGDRLNFYFSGAVASSYPPQAFAMEVRPYHEPEEASGGEAQ